MEIKDFKAGQIVYTTDGKNIIENKVEKVGRKYVFIHTGSWEEKYEVPLPGDGDKNLYLIEAKEENSIRAKKIFSQTGVLQLSENGYSVRMVVRSGTDIPWNN